MRVMRVMRDMGVIPGDACARTCARVIACVSYVLFI